MSARSILVGMPIERFEQLRACVKTDGELARMLCVSGTTVSQYRIRHDIKVYDDRTGSIVSRKYRPQYLMTEEQIKLQYKGHRYEDDPWAMTARPFSH